MASSCAEGFLSTCSLAVDEEADAAADAEVDVEEAAAEEDEPRDAATIADKAAAAFEPELMACLNASMPAFDVELDMVYVDWVDVYLKI